MRKSFLLSLSASALLTLTAVCQAQTAVVSTTTTSTDGTITEFSPETIVVRTESAPEPVRYSFSKTVTYVDDTGAPVSAEIVKSGIPVTVHYIREGDRTLADRVVVHRQKIVTPATTVEKTVTAPALAPAVVEEKSTTTTTTTNK